MTKEIFEWIRSVKDPNAQIVLDALAREIDVLKVNINAKCKDCLVYDSINKECKEHRDPDECMSFLDNASIEAYRRLYE